MVLLHSLQGNPSTNRPPLGAEVDWAPVEAPAREPLRGTHVVLRPVDAATDAEPLYALSIRPTAIRRSGRTFPTAPTTTQSNSARCSPGPRPRRTRCIFTLVSLEGRPLGLASYQRITPEFGVIEIGHIWFGPPLRRTTAATEAIFLLARHAFDDLGYRRLEWKCNALNAPSRRAAERFGFTFEGVFRQHQVIKGRNRDTAWFAITDDEWPAIRRGFQAWLAPANFDRDGVQKRALRDCYA